MTSASPVSSPSEAPNFPCKSCGHAFHEHRVSGCAMPAIDGDGWCECTESEANVLFLHLMAARSDGERLDAYAFGREEIRHLMIYRQLSSEARGQLDAFAAHLAARGAEGTAPTPGTGETPP